MLKPSPLSSEIPSNLPIKLASVIDEYGGDYPLVSCSETANEPAMVWLYSKLVIEVYLTPEVSPHLEHEELGGLTVKVKNHSQAMDLLRQTESIRQQRDFPYIQIN
ncbi:hypothetical protein MCEMSHM24_03137 [Comamonadaceae bacterium]